MNLCGENRSPAMCCKDLVETFGCVLEPVATPLSESARRQASTSTAAYYSMRRHYSRYSLDGRTLPAIYCVLKSVKVRQILHRILGDFYFLYNEQYIGKPSKAYPGTAFDWHRDSDRAGTVDAFISLWFALTDVNESNGSLVFRPHSSNLDCTVERISAIAGSLVIISHNVEHCSTPNHSMDMRVAYMVQFSQRPMVDDSNELVAFAVPIYEDVGGLGNFDNS